MDSLQSEKHQESTDSLMLEIIQINTWEKFLFFYGLYVFFSITLLLFI